MTCITCVVFVILLVGSVIAQDPPIVLLTDYPVMEAGSMYLLEGGVNGMLNSGDVQTPNPWQAFQADAVHIYGYANYDGLVRLMRDPVYVPYKTERLEDGEEYGLVVMTIVKYSNSTAGPYNEVVINAAARAGNVRIVKGCSLGTTACHFREHFTTPDFKWYTLKMWLNEELPVAAGQQMFGINKSLADALYISMKPRANQNKKELVWSMRLEDTGKGYRKDETRGRVTTMSVDLLDTPQTMGDILDFAADMYSAVLASMSEYGKPGEPSSLMSVAQGFMDPLMSGGMVKSDLVQPVGIYPKNFGKKSPVRFTYFLEKLKQYVACYVILNAMSR